MQAVAICIKASSNSTAAESSARQRSCVEFKKCIPDLVLASFFLVQAVSPTTRWNSPKGTERHKRVPWRTGPGRGPSPARRTALLLVSLWVLAFPVPQAFGAIDLFLPSTFGPVLCFAGGSQLLATVHGPGKHWATNLYAISFT